MGRFKTFEIYFFYSLVLVHLIPVFLSTYFPTVDGPAHLYNSRLVQQILSADESPLTSYYALNGTLNPNWMGHLILVLLLTVFPGFIAEKILLLGYLIGFPLGFRFLVKSITGEVNFAVYFIFPFTYSFLFYFGFYNFQLGLIFLFLAVGVWNRALSDGFKWQSMLLLSFLTLCIYFSHLFVLGIFLVIVFFLNTQYLLPAIFQHQNRRSAFKNIGWQFMILVPVFALTVAYFISDSSLNSGLTFLGFEELWKMIEKVQPAKGVSFGKEDIFVKWIFYLFLLLIGYQLIIRFRSFRDPVSRLSRTWFLLMLFSLVGLFVFPDEAGAAGLISSRMVLFFFLFFIVFLATQKFPGWLRTVSFIIIVYVSVSLLNIYISSARKNQIITNEMVKVVKSIQAYSNVLPLNDSGYWLYNHSSNYLGADKPMIILENYEASLPYFPLRWNTTSLPGFHLGGGVRIQEIVPTTLSSRLEQVDYVFVLGPEDGSEGNLEKKFKSSLDTYYELIYISDSQQIRLYQKHD